MAAGNPYSYPRLQVRVFMGTGYEYEAIPRGDGFKHSGNRVGNLY